ncbi:MAG: FHA domain-containing protein [Lachnospiraceae bacterium]|nr:FHA domain-containing protein [Lachnospiraceae bacterium]
MNAWLIILDENRKIKICELADGKKLSFGRETETLHPDISVSSGIVSRDHGEFCCNDGQWFYMDHGGKNGTFINGEKVPSVKRGRRYPVLLDNGDLLQVDYSDLTNPDARGIKIIFSTEKIEDEQEARKLFTNKISLYN